MGSVGKAGGMSVASVGIFRRGHVGVENDACDGCG